MDVRSTLIALNGEWASSMLFNGRRATGVEYQQDIGPGRRTVTARREVVQAACAINSPKLLMLLGIGLAAHLHETVVDVLVDTPGVGSNLNDHVERIVTWEAARPKATRSTQWREIGLFTRTRPGLDRPA